MPYNLFLVIPRSFVHCQAKRKSILDVGSQSNWHISYKRTRNNWYACKGKKWPWKFCSLAALANWLSTLANRLHTLADWSLAYWLLGETTGILKDNWILWYALNCIIIPCKSANKLPSCWANEAEQTNKLANERTIHWKKYNTLKLGNNTANKESSEQDREIHDVLTSFSVPRSRRNRISSKTKHKYAMCFYQSQHLKLRNSQWDQRLTVFKLS